MSKQLVVVALFFASIFTLVGATNVIRVNQIGYLEDDAKVAVMFMPHAVDSLLVNDISNFTITNVATKKTQTVDKVTITENWAPMEMSLRIHFSSVTIPGEYYITALGTQSPLIKIGNSVYDGAQEIPLHYMRQQRCGYNPSLKSLCHQHDGTLVLSGENDGIHIDVTGGWHDASDYLQYLTTSANAVYQMLFAYKQSPEVWRDEYNANGDYGANGIPDILDEARWGLEWMRKMNPSDSLFLNQIADDRDHRYAGLPAKDTVDYGWGKGKARPVYPCSGKPYGLMGNYNDSKGLASSVGKFCSSFALGAEIFEGIDNSFAKDLLARSRNAYNVAKSNPGACQTAPCASPYYYEEDNWVDDMELAAMEMFRSTENIEYLKDAVDYARQEPITPWMGADSAHHYQWYPFVNIGHYHLALNENKRLSDEAKRNMRSGLQRVAERAGNNAFINGIPFIWCSNNLTVAFVTQAMLYRELTGDNSFVEIETAMRDWLFGVNPWGKCMVVGFPQKGDYPKDPHAPLTNLEGIQVTGGLVDGPVYYNIFKSLKGVHLRNEDKYAGYQNNVVVYHDDYADYSTNEPTMDGTASMTFFLGKLASKAKNK